MTTFLTNILLLLELARIIAGETPGCPLQAKIAVGHVHSRNAVWYGRATPSALDWYAALNWQNYPDPTHGAGHLIHPDDRDRMPWLTKQTAAWTCAHTAVEAWR